MISFGGIQVGIPGPVRQGEEKMDMDAPQIFFPANLERWKKELEDSAVQLGEIAVAFESCAGPDSVAIAFCHCHDSHRDVHGQLMEKKFFGFVIDHETLRNLRAVIDLALEATRSEPPESD
ncbi:MAG: hypothetical protein Q8P75_00530 [bacterium]|nr:hypothetical protein [bacterium]